VLWWVAAGGFPSWEEGAKKLETLADNGPAPSAFTFSHPFVDQGAPGCTGPVIDFEPTSAGLEL
jgi:hypothetical protein